MNSNTSFAPVPYRLGLYPVVDSLVWLLRMLEAGVKTIQLRIKDRPETQVAEDIEAAVLLGQRYNARVFINDYWQLAIRYGSYGVHLGQEDMNNTDADAIRIAGLRLGLSTHNEKELTRALTWQPSYISLGHIFPTSTKVMTSSPQGLEGLRRLVAKLPPTIPSVAIGGIGREQLEAILECGVGGIAVVRAITCTQNWHQETSTLLSIIETWERNHG